MREYFLLQWKMMNRNLRSFGINPLLGGILTIVAFLVLSFYLYQKTEYASYALAFIALAFVYPLNEERRYEFLKMIFRIRDLYIVRIIENIVVVFPFALYILFKHQYIISLALIVLAVFISFVNPHKSSNFTLPTPFGKNPFEWMVGFRKSIFSILAAYLITVIAIIIGNFNLGGFGLILIFLIGLGFNAVPENEYYVWNYKLTPKQFIIKKLMMSVLHSTYLTVPVVIALSVAFSEIKILLIIQLVGYLALCVVILAKYSAYPNQINIPQFIVLILSIQFPPLLIIVIPYFYTRAIRHLSRFLT